MESLGEKGIQNRVGDFSDADQVEEDNVHSEELGKVVNIGAEGVGGELMVRPLEITLLRSRTVDGVEIIHID